MFFFVLGLCLCGVVLIMWVGFCLGFVICECCGLGFVGCFCDCIVLMFFVVLVFCGWCWVIVWDLWFLLRLVFFGFVVIGGGGIDDGGCVCFCGVFGYVCLWCIVGVFDFVVLLVVICCVFGGWFSYFVCLGGGGWVWVCVLVCVGFFVGLYGVLLLNWFGCYCFVFVGWFLFVALVVFLGGCDDFDWCFFSLFSGVGLFYVLCWCLIGGVFGGLVCLCGGCLGFGFLYLFCFEFVWFLGVVVEMLFWLLCVVCLGCFLFVFCCLFVFECGGVVVLFYLVFVLSVVLGCFCFLYSWCFLLGFLVF